MDYQYQLTSILVARETNSINIQQKQQKQQQQWQQWQQGHQGRTKCLDIILC